MTKFSLVMTPTPCKSGWKHYLYQTYEFMRPCTYLLTRNNQCFGDWPV